MNIQKLAAFSNGSAGGNPAGVVLCDQFPSAEAMQTTAAEVGFSETAFAHPIDGSNEWRVRYFAPESEVAFCGHATIALGAALTEAHGAGTYHLTLNQGQVTVSGRPDGKHFEVSLTSPRTHSEQLEKSELNATLALFDYSPEQLDPRIAAARINAGNNHYLLVLNSAADLSAMHYNIDEGRLFMQQRDLVTIMLVSIQSPQHFLVRNAFASGGVLEDPATGAAAAAFMGYLRDVAWPHRGRIQINQGDDMGQPSRIIAECVEGSNDIDANGTGAPITLTGFAHFLE